MVSRETTREEGSGAQLSPIQASGGQPGQPGQPSSAQASAPGSGEKGQQSGSPSGSLKGFDKRHNGKDQADWAKLKDNTLRKVRSGGVSSFAEEHQEAIRAFYRRLQEEQ